MSIILFADLISMPGRPVPLSPGVDPCGHAHLVRSHAVCCLFVFFFSWRVMLGVVAGVVMVSGRVEPRRGDKPDVTEVLLSVTCRREIVVCMTGRRTARTVDDTKTCEWCHSVSDVVWNLAIYMSHDRPAAGLHGVIDRSYIQRTPCIDLNELDLTTEFLATRRT